jgi:pilus assembly protein CpaE
VTDLRILLATPSAGYEQRVRQAFDTSVNGDLQRWDAALASMTPDTLLAQLVGTSPDVVAIGPDLQLPDALALASHLERHRPEISVVLVSDPSPELWRDALRAGVTDVVSPDAVSGDLREVFDRALDVAARRRHNLVGDANADARTGRIITMLSPKGGSGKTTMCSNLAVALAMASPDQVAIVDLDTQFGDVSTALRLTPEHTLLDAVRAPSHDDSLTLKSFLTPHSSSLWSLCGPDSPVEGEEIRADAARDVVAKLGDEFAYVVVDTSAGLTEHTLAVIDISTDLVLMCAMDVASIRSLRKEVDALDQLGLTQARRHFVINRADSKVGLDIKDVEATVGMPVDISVPSSHAVPLSMNQGIPVVESQPRSPVARQMTQLAGRFTGSRDDGAGAVFSLLRRGKDGR